MNILIIVEAILIIRCVKKIHIEYLYLARIYSQQNVIVTKK